MDGLASAEGADPLSSPSPPAQINVQFPVGTHVNGHPTLAYTFPQPEADIQVTAHCAGSQASCQLLTCFLVCRYFWVLGQKLYQCRMPALFPLLSTWIMWQQGQLSWTSINGREKTQPNNPPSFTRQEGCGLTNNLLEKEEYLICWRSWFQAYEWIHFCSNFMPDIMKACYVFPNF